MSHTPQVLAAANQVETDLEALGMSTRALLTLLRAEQPPAGGGGGGDGGWYATGTYTSGASTAGGGSITPDAALAAGDLLLLIVYLDSGTGNPSITPPSGFTAADYLSGGFSQDQMGIYWKIADGTETSVAWTTSISRIQRGHLRHYHPGTGLSFDVSPIDVADISFNGSTSTNLTTPVVSVTNAGCRLTHVWAHRNSYEVTLPAVDDAENTFTSQNSLASGDVVQESSGSSTGLTATTGTGTSSITAVVAVKPPA